MDGDPQQREGSVAQIPMQAPARKVKKQLPQVTVDEFWTKFNTAFPGKVSTILPKDNVAKVEATKNLEGRLRCEAAGRSYEEAAAECIKTVEKIATECRRVNLKYRDPHFDIEWDLKRARRDCLDGLVSADWDLAPGSVKRISYIFDSPVFYQEGATASDVRQGANGDCWFLSALCALGNKKNLIDKVCVHRDELVGVYGFVFHRDGEWIQTIIDDKLYLTAPDFDENSNQQYIWQQQINMQDPEEEYRKTCQSGSRALYFAQCSSENETWLPLLEKAYAKAHGDFNAIQGGFTGEAIEDLTGGVTTELFTTDILDTEKFWADEVMKVNKEFLFSCSTGVFDNWQDGGWGEGDRKGVVAMHAYSILDAREVKGEKLILVRNPWGKSEWTGAWSDGSEQWTPEWMELLNHRFGDDGMFWMSYKDLLRRYQAFDRTRLFGPEWNITQQWTTLNIPWSADFLDTKFRITLTKKSPVVVVLSQLDDRYFIGLEGQYIFTLHFRLEKEGETDYIVRSHGNYNMKRSVNVDIDLEPGTYFVRMNISAKRDANRASVEEVIRDNCKAMQDKLIQIGQAYDLAHAKGQNQETETEKKEREARQEKTRVAQQKLLHVKLREQKLRNWQLEMKQRARERRHAKRKEERHSKKAEATTPNGEAGQDVLSTPQGAPVKADSPGAVTNGVAAAEAGADLVETRKSENTPADQDAAHLPSPPAELSLPAASISAGNPTPPTEAPIDTPTKAPAEASIKATPEALPEEPPEATTEAQDSVPVEPIEAVALTGVDPPSEESAQEASKDLQPPKLDLAPQIIPSVLINGTSLDNHPAPPSTADGPLLDDSDYASDASFDSSVDSDLDFLTGQEATVVDGVAETDDEDAGFANDPWNAVCVVGLRVYSKDQEMVVQVVRPTENDSDDEPARDLDDMSKGPSREPAEDTPEAKVEQKV